MSKDKTPPTSESAEYDNFIGEKNNELTPQGLDAFGLEVAGTDPQSAEVHWVGMPEFKQDDQKPFKTLYVHFRTEADYKHFETLIGQILTKKTKSIWHPRNDATKNSELRWIESE